MKQQTEDDKDLIGTVSITPFWHNGCHHPKDAYVGSIETIEGDKLDVYVFEDDYSHNQHVCIREGNEAHEYLSPGALSIFLMSTHSSNFLKYRSSLYVLEFFGNIVWEKHVQKKM